MSELVYLAGQGFRLSFDLHNGERAHEQEHQYIYNVSL